MDWEQIAQEDALWPWLASDCMADPCGEDWLADGWEDDADDADA